MADQPGADGRGTGARKDRQADRPRRIGTGPARCGHPPGRDRGRAPGRAQRDQLTDSVPAGHAFGAIATTAILWGCWLRQPWHGRQRRGIEVRRPRYGDDSSVRERSTLHVVTYGEGSSGMARTRDDRLWALAHAERAALAKE